MRSLTHLTPCLIALLMAPSLATAQTPPKPYALTVYGAYRDGGTLTNDATSRDMDIDGSAAWSLAFDTVLDQSRQVQLFLSRQRTDLIDKGATITTRLPLHISYLHFGGTYFFEGPVGRGPYVVGGLGASFMQLDGEGYGDELRPSMNLGVGYQWAVAQNLALRLEARLYATLVNSSGGLFCSGGCVISIRGETITQGEVGLGLSVPF